MKANERRQARGLAGVFLADPYRKLAAVALAIVLWLFLDNRIEREQQFTVRLVATGPQRAAPLGNQLAVVLPTEQVVGRRFFDADQGIEAITIVLTGPRHRVDSYERQGLQLQFAGLDIDWSRTTSIELTAADIERGPELKDVRIEMRPARIRLEVEKIVARELQLSPALVDIKVEDPGLEPRLQRDSARFSSPTVRILGSQSSIDVFETRARGEKPLLARLKGQNDRQITAVLELTTPPELGLRLVENPSITVQVLPVTEVFELEVRLLVDDLALPAELQGRYQPVPEARTRTVRIHAGGPLRALLTNLRDSSDPARLREYALNHLRLAVWINAPEAGTRPPDDLVRDAVLVLQGPLRGQVDRAECALAEPVSITLRRTP